MTAKIVLYGTQTERSWFPPHRFSGDLCHDANGSVSGQLWERVAEGNRVTS